MDNFENNNQESANQQPYQYVYPHPAGSPQPVPPKQSGARIVGIAAIFLAVAVLFTAIGGGLAYRYLNGNSQDTQQTSGITQTDSTSQTSSTTTGDSGKHWSIGDAATRTDGDALSIMEIAALGKKAVVAINTTGTATDIFGNPGQFEAAGSGFVITADGYIVTNNHVIADADTITVVMDSGDIYDATLVGADSKADLAVLKVNATNLPAVYLGTSATLEVGELAVAIGNPLGELSGTVTAGIISALDREVTIDSQSMNLLQTDAAINPGNSGGPLFNSFGEVIAINTAKTSQTGVEGLGFAIPIDDAKPIIEDLINYHYVKGRTKIGISTRDVTDQMAQYYNLHVGIYIVDVEAGSPADKAGLTAEDIIIAANGQQTLTISSLMAIKDTLKPGDTLKLTIVRDKKQLEITVVLTEDIPVSATNAG